MWDFLGAHRLAVRSAKVPVQNPGPPAPLPRRPVVVRVIRLMQLADNIRYVKNYLILAYSDCPLLPMSRLVPENWTLAFNGR
jgi:hypothetical protein